METVYILTSRETGEVFSSYSTEEKANESLANQEERDMKDEVYEPNYYLVKPIGCDDVRFADAVKWADK